MLEGQAMRKCKLSLLCENANSVSYVAQQQFLLTASKTFQIIPVREDYGSVFFDSESQVERDFLG
jgi:hypothetical protein